MEQRFTKLMSSSINQDKLKFSTAKCQLKDMIQNDKPEPAINNQNTASSANRNQSRRKREIRSSVSAERKHKTNQQQIRNNSTSAERNGIKSQQILRQDDSNQSKSIVHLQASQMCQEQDTSNQIQKNGENKMEVQEPQI